MNKAKRSGMETPEAVNELRSAHGSTMNFRLNEK